MATIKWKRRIVCFMTLALLGSMTSACRHQKEPVQPVSGGDPARGHQQIVAYGCGACHIIPGIDQAHGLVGPPLTHFAQRTYIAGQLPNNPTDLVRWIMMPQAVERGTAMPDLGVSDREARDIAAYLYTLR